MLLILNKGLRALGDGWTPTYPYNRHNCHTVTGGEEKANSFSGPTSDFKHQAPGSGWGVHLVNQVPSIKGPASTPSVQP